MSTWTSKAALACAAALLIGCAGNSGPSRNAPAAIKLPDGLVVAGARGWCIDRSTLQTDGDASVVVLGSCAALAADIRQPRPPVTGLVTVSVENDAGDLPPAETLKAFFQSTDGRAALARDGRAESVRILEIRTANDAIYLHARDRSAPSPAAEDYWRAIFDIDGRFVTVSLVGLGDAVLPRERGIATLDAQVARLKAAN